MKNTIQHIVIRSFATIIIFLYCCIIAAAGYTVKELPFVKELPSGEITALHQDKEGFIWIGTSHGIGRYDGHSTIMLKSDYNNPSLLTDNHINCIDDNEIYVCVGTKKGINLINKRNGEISAIDDGYVRSADIRSAITDRMGNIWFSAGNTLYQCDNNGNIKHKSEFFNRRKAHISGIYEDNNGYIWICTWGSGLYCMKDGIESVTKFPDIGLCNRPYSILHDSKGRYWIGTWGDGLYRFYPDRKDSVYVKASSESGIFYDMAESKKDGRLWMLSYEKLCIFDTDRNNGISRSEMESRLPANRIYSTLMCDRDDNIWVGAFDAGYVIYRQENDTEVYEMPFMKEITGFDTNINCIYETGKNTLLVNQERLGLTLYDTERHDYKVISVKGHRLFEMDFIEPSADGSSLWMTSKFVPYIFRTDIPDGQDDRLAFRDTVFMQNRSCGKINDIHEDRNGTLWVIADKGLYAREKDSDTALLQKEAGKVYCIAEDADGNIWTGNNNHISRIRKQQDKRLLIDRNTPDNRMGKVERIAASGSLIWFATELGGIYCYDMKSDRTKDCTKECGLHNGEPVINLEAYKDELWIVTPYKIICRRNDGVFRNMIHLDSDDCPIKSFAKGALYINGSGKVYACGHGGVLCIPENTKYDGNGGRVFISGVSNNGKRAAGFSVANDSILIPAGTNETKLYFSSLRYPSATRYAYMLEGINSKWNFTEKNGFTADFNTLPPGTYRLSVGCGNDGSIPQEGEYRTYTVIKLPLWYETVWFRIILALAVCGLAIAALFVYLRIMRKKQKKHFEEELTKAKIDYFTQISHELLNPLTVISCISEELEKRPEESGKIAGVIKNNISHLKRLVSQVLEMRKIEHKKLALRVEYGDIAGFIKRKTEENFRFLCGNKCLTVNYDIQPNEIYAFFDRGKIEEILLNLLTNAIKYTPEGRNIGICIKSANEEGGKYIRISVWDEGIGISNEERKNIFKMFHGDSHGRSDSNGIGLCFTKELVELHHGEISVDSIRGRGSEFTVIIPADRERYDDSEVEEVHKGHSSASLTDKDGRHSETVLAIDDNNEILEALELVLGTEYNVLKAGNMKEGTDILEHNNVDVIICDIMLNGENGIELCRNLKQDINTSHIPVLMLTAVTDADTRKACYEAGAEGFLAKPFDTRVLTARIANLVEANRKRKERFRTSTETNVSELTNSGNDKNFLEQCVSIINRNIDSPELNLDFLSEELCMSRSTVNRKIKALSGLTPMDFVKNLRIKYACSLLKSADMNISETAYRSGFSDPKYFARCFKDVTGVTPTQYQQKHSG